MGETEHRGEVTADALEVHKATGGEEILSPAE